MADINQPSEEPVKEHPQETKPTAVEAAEVIKPATEQSAPVAKKASHKTLYIILGIIAALLLCGCVIVLAVLVVIPAIFKVSPDVITDYNSKYQSYLAEYDGYVSTINSRWDNTNSCDQSEAYNEAYDSVSADDKANLPGLKTTINGIIDEEKECYVDNTQFEMSYDSQLYNKMKDFDCTKVTSTNSCATFVKDLAKVLETNQKLVDAYNTYYKEWSERDNCYIDAAINLTDNDSMDDIEAQCEAEFDDNSATIESYDDTYKATVKELSQIVDSDLVTTTTPATTTTTD